LSASEKTILYQQQNVKSDLLNTTK